ncbi:MAG: hypothetical protein IJV38_06215 [Prevotella sp.]|nr:hypothetical protein [Prevotella sp.]
MKQENIINKSFLILSFFLLWNLFCCSIKGSDRLFIQKNDTLEADDKIEGRMISFKNDSDMIMIGKNHYIAGYEQNLLFNSEVKKNLTKVDRLECFQGRIISVVDMIDDSLFVSEMWPKNLDEVFVDDLKNSIQKFKPPIMTPSKEDTLTFYLVIKFW